MTDRHFGWADYGVIGVLLVVFVVLGLIPACTGGKQKTPVEFLRGNKRLSLIPVALSLSVSYVSALSMLGFPAEMYFFGIQFILMPVATSIGALIAAFTFLPVMYQTQTSSVNMEAKTAFGNFQYLLKRFSSKTVKYVGTLLQTAYSIFLSAMVILGPAIFIGTVSDLPKWACILLIGSIATLCTALGGLKAVIWTDVLQAGIIYIGILIVLIQGTLKSGSIRRTWQLYSEGDRINFNFTPSPLERTDVWVMLLQFPQWVTIYGTNQLAVQRYTSIPTLERARRCVLLQIPCSCLFYTSSMIMGIVAYGYYAELGCDPFSAGYIHSVNEIIPYMVMEVMTLPGLPGLFFMGLLAGALSNISSFLVAIAHQIWEDLFSDEFRNFSDIHRTYIIKTLDLVSGILATCMAFVMMEIGGTLIQMLYSVTAAISVPLSVIFILAGAWPPANSKAALVSSLLAFGVIFWISQGALHQKYPPQYLPLVTDGCHSNATSLNGTMNYVTTNSMTAPMDEPAQDSRNPSWMNVYKISYLWYKPLGFIIGTVSGILLSMIPGFKTKDKFDERYIFPCLRGFFRSYLIQNDPVSSEENQIDEPLNGFRESHTL